MYHKNQTSITNQKLFQFRNFKLPKALKIYPSGSDDFQSFILYPSISQPLHFGSTNKKKKLFPSKSSPTIDPISTICCTIPYDQREKKLLRIKRPPKIFRLVRGIKIKLVNKINIFRPPSGPIFFPPSSSSSSLSTNFR